MIPSALTAKAIELGAMMLASSTSPLTPTAPVVAVNGAYLSGGPRNATDTAAVRDDPAALGGNIPAEPLLTYDRRDLATDGVARRSTFESPDLASGDVSNDPAYRVGPATVSAVTALLRDSFGARITDTVRPTNATYGAQRSWHKVGQAIDFVPAGGVGAINRAEIRALMATHGVRIIELLGPGNPGHSNHWHVAFALPGQSLHHMQTVEGDEDWIVGVGRRLPMAATDQPGARPPASGTAQNAPPAWDVFATAEWRTHQGGG